MNNYGGTRCVPSFLCHSNEMQRISIIIINYQSEVLKKAHKAMFTQGEVGFGLLFSADSTQKM